MIVKDLNSFEINKCPMCGSPAHIEDLSKNKIGHKNIVYGRIVCNNNQKGWENRCYIKTVCGEFSKVLLSWNQRVIISSSIKSKGIKNER